jgi:hypothetical protein
MTENEYSLADIEDKKDFSVHLMDYVNLSEFGFCIDSRFFKNILLEELDPAELPDSEPSIRILSDTPKGIIPSINNYFHFFSDFIGPIYVFLENCINQNFKKVEIVVIEHSFISNNKNYQKLNVFFEYFLNSFLDKIEVIYTKVTETEEPGFFEINNSMNIRQQDIGISIDFIYDLAKKFSNALSDKKPSKKVFISRKNDLQKDNSENRNLNQDEVEDFFASIGFEVVNGEGFFSLKEQIGFFNEVSVFAGFTGSGLTSSMFMQPGQTLIEVVCPLKFSLDQNNPKYEIHNFYKTISMLKKHKYVAISNINNSKEDLMKQLEDVAKMLQSPSH